jgi:hypothetical protein
MLQQKFRRTQTFFWSPALGYPDSAWRWNSGVKGLGIRYLYSIVARLPVWRCGAPYKCHVM